MIGAIIARNSVAKAFDAMNRKDLTTFMKSWWEDGEFICPGDIPECGTFTGREAVEKWFRNFFDQYPRLHFNVADINVKNIFAMSGNNVVTVHWDIELKNRNGKVGRNSGVTVITIKGGRALHVKDYIFDLGEEFRVSWSPKKITMKNI